MKEINELLFNDKAIYTEDHEWALKDGDAVLVGISDYAQDQLGDIVFVELPEIGSEFEKGEEFGTVESTKAVSELYMPISGKIVGANEDLEDTPDLVNSDPYGKGWIVKIEPKDPKELEELMTKDAYLEMLKGL